MENNKKTKRQRRIIITLAIALGLAGTTAIVAPLALTVFRRGGNTPAGICTVKFSSGAHGKFTGESSGNLTYTFKKGDKLGSYLTQAKNLLITDDGYAFISWILPDGSVPTSETVVNSDLTITAKHKSTDSDTINISLLLQSDEKLEGRNPSTLIAVAKTLPYSEIKKQLPDAKKTGYNFKYWTLEKGSSKEIPDTTLFTKDTTLYPYFVADPTKYQIVFKFEALTGQTFVGNSSTTIDFDESKPTTWAEITKRPEVTQDGKVFAGWYHEESLTNPWKDTDKISKDDCTAYAKMITVDKSPIITFSAKGTEEKPVTWYGNQIVKCNTENPLFETVIKPIPYYDASGEPSTGITTNYYFSRWVEKDENGNYSPVRNRIDQSITIYPEFEQKPSIVYYTDDKETPTPSDPIQVDPNLTWSSVSIKQIPKSESANKLFTGWKQKNSSGTDKIIYPDTPLKELEYDKEDPTKKPIIPIFEENCNKITFSTKDSGGADVTYTGCAEVGVSKKGGLFANINKPVPARTGASFLKWEIKTSTDPEEWTPVTDTTTLPDTGSTYTEFTIRPVMESTFTLSFDKGEHGEIEAHTWTIPPVSSSTKFKDMFVPSVVPTTGYKFKYWATRTGTGTAEDPYVYTQVDADQTFSEATTLYAYYGTDVTTSIVNFHLKPTDDPESPQYDGTGKATIAGITIALDNPDGDKTFTDIPHAVVSKEYHKLKCWATKESDGTYKPLADDYILPLGGSGLNVYAVFEPRDTYNLIKVKEPDAGEYEILTDNYVYLLPDETLTFTGDKNFGVEVKKVGYKVKGWINCETLEPVDETTKFNKNAILEPEFAECQRNVIFSKDGDNTIQGFEDGKELMLVDNYGNLSEALDKKALKPTKPNGDIFIGWQIKTGDVYSQVSKSTIVTTNLVLVPMFRGESEFAKGQQPYYFDKDKGQWAAMTSFENDEIDVFYADETTGKKSKANFNEKVYFGSQMTTLPYKFMEGCSNWNNGYDPESTEDFDLVMPTGLTSTGEYAMAGCTSFNQNVIFPSLAQNVTFGQGFMSQCYAFNKDIDLSYAKAGGTLNIGDAFMHDCYNFSSTINITGRTVAVTSTKLLILNTSNATSQFAIAGFKVQCSDAEYTAFNTLLPLSQKDAPYRNYKKA